VKVHKLDLNEDERQTVALFQEITRFYECRKDNEQAYLHNDAVNPGYQILSDRYHLRVTQLVATGPGNRATN
jgi:hypothetical protein